MDAGQRVPRSPKAAPTFRGSARASLAGGGALAPCELWDLNGSQPFGVTRLAGFQPGETDPLKARRPSQAQSLTSVRQARGLPNPPAGKMPVLQHFVRAR